VITTRTPARIDGRDYLGDRWAAHTTDPVPDLDIPALVVIRTLDGNIQLARTDAVQLAGWLTNALTG
jgi:hypothetical protein